MDVTFLFRGLAGRNDADALAIDLDVHDEQKSPLNVMANHRVAGLVIATGIHQPEERIEKHLRRVPGRDVVIQGRAFSSSQTKLAPLRSKRMSMSHTLQRHPHCTIDQPH
ncbi:hypothetical protein [Dokdonella sp.]|uniref:hypothetical protein n=1 Tax=Dokdonella sp. TaxID=2291710 RepID=UPI0025BFC499|nr:hypothetical protein [Dokdonella sp.]